MSNFIYYFKQLEPIVVDNQQRDPVILTAKKFKLVAL